MKLISCDDCGVVLDADKIYWPVNLWTDEGCIRHDLAKWDGDGYRAFVCCPVCSAEILAPEGEN